MTFVVELRDLKKSLPRPIALFCQRATETLCILRFRLACVGLLGLALGYPAGAGGAPRDGVLGVLCAVLTALLSATTGLMCDASSGLSTLLGEQSSSVLKLSQCFAEPVFPLDIAPTGGPFPTFSGHRALALAACALFLFGCGVGRRDAASQSSGH